MSEGPKPNLLYYGDNLDILRRYVEDESVDLVYLDPPFNSNADYNVLFAEKSGENSGAQIKAFGDTWEWGLEAAQEYAEVLHSGHDRVAKALKGMHDFLGGSDMMAYLSMMALRLIELRRVLKPTGSIYLHCDPTASHYLKIIMDAVFGPENFKNEITWKRTSAHSSSKRFGPNFDSILFYSKSGRHIWNAQFTPYDPDYVAENYKHQDPDGRLWRRDNLTGAGVRNGPSGEAWRGYDPTAHGRHWACGDLQERERLLKEGRIGFSKAGYPYYKRYLDEMPGVPLQAFWADIPLINNRSAEFLGYPTQKPEALLERIIRASSNEGDVVLDPFCGCGTAIAAAQKLGRRWMGIDVTHLAITLIKSRLHDTFGPGIAKAYKVIGEPEDLAGAQQLANDDKFQFQVWALGLVGARPLEMKKGADRGIDGRLYFHDSADASESKEALISVKGGGVNVTHVRDLRGTVEREGAAVGVLLCMEDPTKPMLREAAEAGFYTSPAGTQHPRLQILTVEQLLNGQKLDLPAWHDVRTFKKAPKAKGAKRKDAELF